MKKIILLLAVFIVISCNLKSGVNVKVVNMTDNTARNIRLYTSENKEVLTFATLKSGETATDFLTMKENKTDGHYILEFTDEKGKIRKTTAGYYSNGNSSDQEITFEIGTTIQFKKK